MSIRGWFWFGYLVGVVVVAMFLSGVFGCATVEEKEVVIKEDEWSTESIDRMSCVISELTYKEITENCQKLEVK